MNILIDVSPVVHRAYFIEAAQAKRDGVELTTSVTTARLYAMLERLVREWQPTHGVAALDARGWTWRHAACFTYKAHRKPKPNGLQELLGAVPEILAALGLPIAQRSGYEADDVIASLVHRHDDCVIVSSDKDFYQILGVNRCRIWDPMRRPAGAPLDAWPGCWITPQHVHDKFGVPPEGVVDVQALMGDACDGVSGCPGIGQKTAIALIQQHGSVATLYAALEEHGKAALPKHCRRYYQRLIDGRDDVRLSRVLVQLRCDLDVRTGRVQEPDQTALAALMTRWGWVDGAGEPVGRGR